MATLRELLKSKCLTQLDLAERTGLALSTISRAVRGYPLHRGTLTLLCHVLDVSPKDITGIVIYSGTEVAANWRKKKRGQ